MWCTFFNYSTLGRRKKSVANVRITPGTGSIVINGRNYLEYFNHNRYALVKMSMPLRLIDCLHQFDIDVRVKGGGTTGQSDAIVMGLSRALAKFQPEFGYYLTKCMCYLHCDHMTHLQIP